MARGCTDGLRSVRDDNLFPFLQLEAYLTWGLKYFVSRLRSTRVGAERLAVAAKNITADTADF